MTAVDPLKQAWQAEDAAAAPPPLDKVRRDADRLHRQIRRRNRREYIASAVIFPFFGWVAATADGTAERLGALLVVVGCAFVAWQLGRRAPAVPAPVEAGLPLIAHQRTQLVRQRDALRSVATWYLLPLMPGLLLLTLSPALEAAPPFRPSAWTLGYLAFVFGLFAAIWWLNRAAAHALQQEIDALDRLIRGEE